MKRNLLYVLPLSLLLLVACNDEKVKKVTTVEQENTNTQTETKTNNGSTAGTFNISSFSLDVDYGVDDSYEVDFEQSANGVEASVEDRNNKAIKGNDAYSKLEPIFKSFTFTSASTDQDIISEVLKAFELNEDYKEFEAEIHFSDGTIKEFKNKK